MMFDENNILTQAHDVSRSYLDACTELAHELHSLRHDQDAGSISDYDALEDVAKQVDKLWDTLREIRNASSQTVSVEVDRQRELIRQKRVLLILLSAQDDVDETELKAELGKKSVQALLTEQRNVYATQVIDILQQAVDQIQQARSTLWMILADAPERTAINSILDAAAGLIETFRELEQETISDDAMKSLQQLPILLGKAWYSIEGIQVQNVDNGSLDKEKALALRTAIINFDKEYVKGRQDRIVTNMQASGVRNESKAFELLNKIEGEMYTCKNAVFDEFVQD